jgi:hypothetical protein
MPDPKPDLDIDWRNHKCFLEDADVDPTAFRPECNDTSRLLFLWGNSHAASVFPGLANLAKSMPVGVS